MTTARERLRLLYDLSRRLATFTDLDELLRYATRGTRDLFGAEGCSVLLHDAERREFYFPVASQSESRQVTEARLAEVRFPSDRGIAGWVLQNDQAVHVENTATDPRFYGGVDDATAMQTRSLLCAPLRSPAGNIGVVEVINPASGVGADDLEFLEALAGDIAIAHENAPMHRRLRGDLLQLRQITLVAGIALGAFGLLLGGGVIFGHLARAVPLGELVSHPGAWAAAVLVAAGAGLVLFTRR